MLKRLGVPVMVFIFVLVIGCERMDTDKVVEDSSGKNQEGNMAGMDGAAPVMASPSAAATIVLGNNAFTVEIAKTPEERARGLMNRESLAENFGMWFVFPEMGNEEFWMKDTLIPLDLVFVNDSMKVVHIIENAPPGSTELLSSPEPFMFVLEIAGGTVQNKGIKSGDKVEKRIGPN